MDQVVTNRDLWQVIFRFLCHFDIARFAQINRMLQTCVETFFKNTKTLLVAFPHRVNGSKLLRWPLLPYIQHLDIASLHLRENNDSVIDWPCANLITLNFIIYQNNFRTKSILRLRDMQPQLSGSIHTPFYVSVEPDMLPETLVQTVDFEIDGESDSEPESDEGIEYDAETEMDHLADLAADEYNNHPAPDDNDIDNPEEYQQEKRQRLLA